MVPQIMMVTNWQLLEDGESEDSSFTSPSNISNYKSPYNIGASLNEIEEYMYMLSHEGAPQPNQLYINDAMSYQMLSLSHTPPSQEAHFLLHNEEAHSSISKDNYFSNPLINDSKSLPCPLDFDPIFIPHSPIIAPSLLKSLKQSFHIDNAHQLPLLYDPSLPPNSSPPSPFLSHEDSYSMHLLDKYEDSHVKGLAPHCNKALETSYTLSYLPCTTSPPTLPSIISANSSPITSLASHTSAIADTASVGPASTMPPDHCSQDTHFVSGTNEMNLPTRSFINRTSKGKNVEIDKIMKKKRKRTRSRKNSEELESQRMTHIAVERNRRRQMNQHLNDLRSLMPSSYIQRGDQASIVGGAIRLVEELEQVLESLLLQRQIRGEEEPNEQVPLSHLDGDKSVSITKESYACSSSSMVNVQVEMISLSSILVKVIAPKRHHQLLHTLQALHFLSLKVLHLNISTLDISIIYTFNLKMENDCHFQTPLELAKSIHHVFESPKTNS